MKEMQIDLGRRFKGGEKIHKNFLLHHGKQVKRLDQLFLNCDPQQPGKPWQSARRVTESS